MKPEHPHAEQIPALRQLWQEAFGDTDAFLDGFFATAFSPRRCLCVTRGQRVVSAVYWLDVSLADGKGAYIYALATAEDHRGQGLAHALMAAAHSLLKEQGYAAAILVPGEASLVRLYSAMGYRFFGGIHTFSAIAKSPAVALKRISGTEFTALRAQYLPAGAVIQAAENAAFLETYATLYAGADFLLAAWQENDTLSGLELLGNREKAPRILQALGAKQGSFRCPGADPFAMWLPLKECMEPTYFGLAFD